MVEKLMEWRKDKHDYGKRQNMQIPLFSFYWSSAFWTFKFEKKWMRQWAIATRKSHQRRARTILMNTQWKKNHQNGAIRPVTFNDEFKPNMCIILVLGSGNFCNIHVLKQNMFWIWEIITVSLFSFAAIFFRERSQFTPNTRDFIFYATIFFDFFRFRN